MIAGAVFVAMPAFDFAIQALVIVGDGIQRSVLEVLAQCLVYSFVLALIFVKLFARAVRMQRDAILDLGERDAWIQLMKSLGLMLVVVPNAITAIIIGRILSVLIAPFAFALMMLLSYYYALPAAVFGKAAFNTETLIQGAYSDYSQPQTIRAWPFIHQHCKLTSYAASQECRPRENNVCLAPLIPLGVSNYYTEYDLRGEHNVR